jgi:hypothetical protein
MVMSGDQETTGTSSRTLKSCTVRRRDALKGNDRPGVKMRPPRNLIDNKGGVIGDAATGPPPIAQARCRIVATESALQAEAVGMTR